jgi:hypothetical protein
MVLKFGASVVEDVVVAEERRCDSFIRLGIGSYLQNLTFEHRTKKLLQWGEILLSSSAASLNIQAEMQFTVGAACIQNSSDVLVLVEVCAK